MAGRISPSKPNGLPLVLAVNRSVVYTDSADLDILEWIGGNPRIRGIRISPPGSIAEISTIGISCHRGRSEDVTAPSSKQAAFETPPQPLGVGGISAAAALLRLILRRISDDPSPTANYFEEGRL